MKQGVPASELAPLLTLREVATFLRVSERTVRRLIATGELPCLRVGAGLRFSHRALMAWVSAHERS